MLNTTSFPIHLPLILEKASIVVWTSNVNIPNHYTFVINNIWFYSFNKLLKKDVWTYYSYIVDNTALELPQTDLLFTKLKNKLNNLKLFNKYTYYLYFLKIRLSVFTYSNTSCEFTSIDSIWLNSNWLERETSEMYGIFFRNKKDIRRLLLDYSRNEAPLLKEFSSEGIVDCFYSILDNDVIFLNNEVIEL